MVRRWSYINSINTTKPDKFRNMRRAAFNVTITTTMYLRKSYSHPTFLTRRRWSRRKHSYGWLHLANIIKDWAHTYRFYRNYNKAVMNQYLTPNSFLAFNLISAKNSIPSAYKNSELLIVSTFSRKVLRYFNYLSSPRFKLFASFKNVNLSVVSYDPLYSALEKVIDYPFITPLVHHTVEETNLLGDKVALSQLPFSPVMSALSNQFYFSTKVIYRVLILLTLSRFDEL